MKNYFGADYSTAVSNGTAALHLTGLALGWKPNDIIITTPITFLATVNCIEYAGATPEFADINPAGQAFGAMLTFCLFGFFPGYLGSQVLEFFDVLRIPEDLEIGGQDTLSIKKQKEDIAEFAGIEKAVLKEIIEERNN